jgi:hypothetical protein
MGGALGRWTTAAWRGRYWWRPGGRWRARGRAGRGHGGGLRRRAGLGAAHEGERAWGLHYSDWRPRNSGGAVKTEKQRKNGQM